jgi:hypothetical protein
VPTAEKRRASRHAPEKPLAAEPGPAIAAERKVRTSDPADVTAELAQRKWCPLHETSLHNATDCCHINNLVEICRDCLAKHAAMGQPMVVTSVASPATGHATVPTRPPSQEDPVVGEKAWWEPGLGAVRTAATREGLLGVEATTTMQQAAKEEKQGST